MRRQAAGVEVVGAVHVALRVEADDRFSVGTLHDHRRLADDMVDIVPLAGPVVPSRDFATAVGHDSGIRPDPPYAARQVFGDKSRPRSAG
jgi:hypothetical protein